MSADQIPGGEEARSRRRVLAVDRDVRPGEREHATLEELLEKMDPDTFPDLVDYGPPVGKEIW